jgi:hypothetical protein
MANVLSHIRHQRVKTTQYNATTNRKETHIHYNFGIRLSQDIYHICSAVRQASLSIHDDSPLKRNAVESATEISAHASLLCFLSTHRAEPLGEHIPETAVANHNV